MTQLPVSQTLGDEELNRLEELLGSPIFRSEAMWLDELQGFLCAVVSAPDTILPGAWLPVALGENPEYENQQQAEEVLALVMRFYNDVERALQQGAGIALQLYHSEGKEDYDFQSWCRGYLDGVKLSEVNWYEAGDTEEVDELLFPFGVLAGELDNFLRDTGQGAITGKEKAELVAACREDIASTVMRTYQYWVARRSTKTVRREAPKVGRNDPCPCGSGRKFKQCCGAPGKLH